MVTTQLIPPASPDDSPELKLIRESYAVAVLLLRSAHRLRAMLDERKQQLHGKNDS